MVIRYVQAMSSNKKALLLNNLLIDTIGWTLILPALPGLYASFEADTATIGTLTALLSLLTFLCGAVQGIASDFFGRIRMLQMCALSQLIGHMLTIHGLQSKSLYIFVLSRCIPAFFKCCMVVSQAYLFDMEQNIPGNSDVATLYAYSNIAFMSGPLIGGFLVSYSVYYPCIFGLLISAMELTILYFLEESSRSDAWQQSKLIQNSSVANGVSSEDDANGKGKAFNGNLLDLLHIKFAYQLSNALFEALFPQYGRSTFGLSGYATGLCYSLSGVLSALVNMYILPSVLLLRKPEQYLMYVLATTWMGLMIWALWGAMPGLIVAIVVVTIAGNVFLGVIQNAIVVCMKPQIINVDMLYDMENRTIAGEQGGEGLINQHSIGLELSPSSAVYTYAQTGVSAGDSNPAVREFDNWAARLDRVRVLVQQCIYRRISRICILLPSMGIFKQRNSTRNGDGNHIKDAPRGVTNNKAGAIFGISSSADRAARVLAPLMGGFLIQHFGSLGLASLCCASVSYCLALLLWKVPQCTDIRSILSSSLPSHLLQERKNKQNRRKMM